MNIAAIRKLIEAGHTDEEIDGYLAECRAETREAEDFERNAYGIDSDDGMTGPQREFNDRLSMGRNDAGEWLGFM